MLFLLAMFALAGLLARASWLKPQLVWLGLAAVGVVAVLRPAGARARSTSSPSSSASSPGWRCSPHCTAPLRMRGSRTPAGVPRAGGSSCMVAGVLGVAAVGVAVAGRVVGPVAGTWSRAGGCCGSPRSRAARCRPASRSGLAAVTPWQTPNDDFYRIDTAIAVPAIDPNEWQLRIHGMVDSELTLTFDDLSTGGSPRRG